MKKLSFFILTCQLLAANNSLHAISPAKIMSSVKNKVSSWLYQQEEVIKQDIKCTTQKKLVIENANGNINIKTWKQDGIVIKMVKRAYSPDDLHKIMISIDSSDKESLFIKTKIPSDIVSNCGVDYELLIPQAFELRCATGHGNIKVKNCNGPIQTTTDDGTIELRHTVGKVCATIHSNGEINIQQANGPIEVSTSNGNISLQEANNSTRATATNGCISMSSTVLLPNASIRLDASGSIDLTLPQDTSAHVLATSENGRVVSDHLITMDPHAMKLNKNAWNQLKHKIEGTIGTGKADVVLQAKNGSIRILETEKIA